MTLTAGTRLGPYEVLSPLGAGGMGEVYRARDTRLDRTVAIKVLPSHLADDPERRARFEREARAASALNHPHICTIHDIGQQDGIDYLVMEHLEGETLADRLQKGALPQEQALRIGAQVADALDKAHRAGIVHRDLKPGNVMLTKSGAKLLDFGLARVAEPTGIAGGGLSTFPTQAKPLTEAGSLLGTFQYMAPEQLEGKEADPRTDIFALGSVLYEMLTGRRAFEGKSQASLIAAILEKQPEPISALQPMTPPALDRLVRRCLAKDPDERWQSAEDLAAELKWITDAGSGASVSAASVADRKSPSRLAWSLVASFGALAGGFAWLAYDARAPGSPSRIQSVILPPEKGAFRFEGFFNAGPPALSPDGRLLTYAATAADGKTRLFVQFLASGSARALAGTEGAAYPFWSPDGRFIGFFARRRLNKIAAAGGAVETVCEARPGGGAWTRDGTILFGDPTGPVSRVSSEGGLVSPVTALDAGRHEWSHLWPYFLPDGRRFLYLGRKPAGRDGSYPLLLASLDGHENRFLFNVSSAVTYAAGHLLYVHDGNLVAQPFDPARGLPFGKAIALAEHVRTNPLTGRAAFSVSDSGLLVYQAGEGMAANDLTWFDRSGKVLGVVGGRRPRQGLRIAPDGRRVAEVARDASLNMDIWIDDLTGSLETRFTFDPGQDFAPVWSPDGSRIAFTSSRTGRGDLYVKPASGARAEELLVASPNMKATGSWSSDGRYLAYSDLDPKTSWDIWILPLAGDRKPFPFLRTPFDEGPALFSPDGRWIAYNSDETGRNEIYVAPFPGPGGKWQVSSDGGLSPRWRRDGKELFYVSPDQKVMAVGVRAGPGFESAAPVPLFAARFLNHLYYDVSADGQRFLVETEVPEEPTPLTLVVNWTAGLER